MRYENCRLAFLGALSDLIDRGHVAEAIIDAASPASSFGRLPRESIELIGNSFLIADPSTPVVSTARKAFDLEYGVGLLLWTLAGSSDQRWIEYYQSVSGYHWLVPWGDRLFNNRGVDQMANAEALLRKDPGSRRAFMPIFDLQHLHRAELGLPCAAGFQLFVRQGALHAVGVMRAQDALNSLQLDLFILCYLQILAADKMGLSLGTYSHMCTTFTIFCDQREMAHDVASELNTSAGISLGDARGAAGEIRALIEFEKKVRRNVLENNIRAVENMADISAVEVQFCSEFAVNMAKMVLVAAFKKCGSPIGGEELGLRRDLSNLLG